MNDINDYLSDLRKLESNLPKYIEKIIMKNKSKLLSMLKLRLWNFGVDAKGNKILPDYKPSTIAIKKEDGKRSSHVTLRDTGAFYAGIYMIYANDELFISSKDSKTPLLIEKYGQDILGLTKQEQDILIFSIIEPEIQKILNNLPDVDLM